MSDEIDSSSAIAEQTPSPEIEGVKRYVKDIEPSAETIPVPEGQITEYRHTCLILYSALLALIILLDGGVLAAILKNKVLRKIPSNMCACSVLASSLITGVLVIPAHIMNLYSNGQLPNWVCILCEYSAYVSVSANIFSQMASSIHRLRVILLRPYLVSSPQVHYLLYFVWIISVTYAIRVYFVYHTDTSGMCTVQKAEPWYTIFKVTLLLDVVVLYIMPTVVIGMTTCLLAECEYRKDPNAKTKTDDKKLGIKSFTMLWLAFLSTQFPHRACTILINYWAIRFDPLSIHAVTMAKFFNSVLNPILILIGDHSIRLACRELLVPWKATKTPVRSITKKTKSYP